MSLLQVANTLITSGNEAQIIKLENCITTDDVYMLVGSNIQVGGSGGICDIQPLVDSTVDTSNNISISWFDLKANTTFQAFGNNTQDIWRVTDGMNTAPNAANFMMYLYNWYSSSEYSYITMEVTSHNGSNLRGYQQGGVKKETTSFNGVNINTNQSGGGGFQAGTQFTLYKVI
tara:strand:+ start:2154 stop:2675 length:522 start_codon:yes stop_codon:yes gene_type:complete